MHVLMHAQRKDWKPARSVYLAHIEGADALDRPPIVNDCRSLPLRLRQNYVYEVLVGGYHLDALEVIRWHGC